MDENKWITLFKDKDMNDEWWLDKIKNRLDDCQEPLPAGGWERLERELGQTGQTAFSSSRTKRVVMRRWSVAAAAALLVAVSGISFWLLHSPAGEEMRRAEVPVVRPFDRMPEPAVQDEALARVEEPVLQEMKPAVVTSREMEHVEPDMLEENLSIVQDNGPQDTPAAEKSEEKEHAAEVVVRSETVHEGQVPAAQGKKKTSLDEPVVLPEPIRKENRGWAFGLSVGKNGASLGNGDAGDLVMGDVAGGGIQGSNINLSATANGVITIPGEQELLFKNGMPYVMQKGDVPVSAEHRLPVSVGLSVRKNLGKGFSVETGLMYTFLSSDINNMVQKLHYLGIPLRVNWNFVDTRNFIVYLSAGGALEKCVYGKLGHEKQTVKPVQWSVLGAMGAQYNLSRRWGLYVEPGVSYYFDDGSPVQTIRKERPCSFTIQAGLRLSY